MRKGTSTKSGLIGITEMIVYLTTKTEFRADILKERGQLACRSLRRRLGLAHSYKVNSSAPSALLGDLPARHSPQDGGGCAFDPARRQSPFRGTSRSLLIKRRPTPFNPSGTARIASVQTAYKPSAVLSMSFHSIAVQNSFLSHNRRIPNGSWCLFREPSDGSRNGKVVIAQSRDIQDTDTGGQYTVFFLAADRRIHWKDKVGSTSDPILYFEEFQSLN